MDISTTYISNPRSPRIPWGFGSERSGGTALRSTRVAKLKIQEFIEEKEDKDPQPLDLIQKSRQLLDRTGAARGLPSRKDKVKY
jgi:hypothetical protein